MAEDFPAQVLLQIAAEQLCVPLMAVSTLGEL